jgi:hypothetical protein
MTYQFTIEREPGYLHAKVAGENSPDSVRRSFADVRRACETHACPNILVEEHLAGPSLHPLEIFRLVEEGSRDVWPVVHRFAYVDTNPEHNAARMQFAETVAVNRGVNIRRFDSVDDARAWLNAQIESAG